MMKKDIKSFNQCLCSSAHSLGKSAEQQIAAPEVDVYACMYENVPSYAVVVADVYVPAVAPAAVSAASMLQSKRVFLSIGIIIIILGKK